MEPTAIPHIVMQLYLFLLSAFIGFEVITKVPVLLHTPLMSGSNALSGIVVVGALTLCCQTESHFGYALALLALFLATVNVVGGFVVTDRMLAMFRSKKTGSSKQQNEPPLQPSNTTVRPEKS